MQILLCSRFVTMYLIVMLLFSQIIFCNGDNYYNTYNWKFHFPEGSSMGIFFAIAMPIDLPNKNVFFSYNFEAVYSLPGNQTMEEYPPLLERIQSARNIYEDNNNNSTFRGIDRKLVYDAIETKITLLGYPGRFCLMRTICEVALMPVNGYNGVLGDLFHIVFTPSSSANKRLNDIYQQAEDNGKLKNDCTMYYRNCSVSFLDFVSWIEHAIETK